MKKHFKKHLLPQICITFTMTFLIASGIHILSQILHFIINHRELSISRNSLFILEFFLLLCLGAGTELAFDKFNLKNKKILLFAEPLIKFGILQLIAYVFCWQGQDLKEFFGIAIILTIYYVNLYLNTRKKCQKEASEINRLIKQRGVQN